MRFGLGSSRSGGREGFVLVLNERAIWMDLENAWEIQKDQSICFCLKRTLFEASIFFLVVLAVADFAELLRPR